MKQDEGKASIGRRDFLKVASVGAAVGAVAVASRKAEAGGVSHEVDTKGGYSKTDHVAKYYELANI